ncbi:MAG: hypothetical protein EOO04_38390 [Chitinophagaceae bacterium]|nr:MAG: hypothetical protein EOO04_38390 [Chitinophagaceae bacterium]
MIPRGLSAAIYTQTTDVEGEVNGFITYDREVIKIPETHLRKLHAPLYVQPTGKISFIDMPNETARNKFRFFKGSIDSSSINPHSISIKNIQSTNFVDNKDSVILKKGESVYAIQDINIDRMPDGLGLKLYGYGDAKIYINGTMVWCEDKIRTKRHYDDINLTDKINLLKPGSNRVLVECREVTQDTRFDFMLYRLDK